MNFEWDERKNQSNLKKHGVDFQEASTAFNDPMTLTFDDPDHSLGEHRLLTFAQTITGALLVISHTEMEEGHLRLISARKMTKHERRIYEDD